MRDQPTPDNEATGIEIPNVISKPKKIIMSLVLGLICFFLFISLFCSKPTHSVEITEKPHAELNSNFLPPKLETQHQEETILSKHDSSFEPSADNTENVMGLRQNAPIQLYVSDGGGSHNVNSSNQPNNSDQPGLSLAESDQVLENTIGQNSPDTSSKSVSLSESCSVSQLKHRDYLLMEGTIIPGILQTAVHSDLSGPIKAQVAEDVYASEGQRILIPKGSTLLGHYSGNLTCDQQRLFVEWTRIIPPNGLSISLKAQGTDDLGQSGLTGAVNHHYLARFGQATLLSVLGVGAACTAADYRTALTSGCANVGKESLQESIRVKPTITLSTGSEVAVYVNQDISFYSFRDLLG